MIFTSYSPKFSYMLCGKTTHDPLGIQTSSENNGWKSLGRHGRHFVLLCLIPAGWTYQCSIANFHPLQISCEAHWRGFPWVSLVDRLRGWGKLYRYGKPRRPEDAQWSINGGFSVSTFDCWVPKLHYPAMFFFLLQNCKSALSIVRSLILLDTSHNHHPIKLQSFQLILYILSRWRLLSLFIFLTYIPMLFN
jgi:hypothetical protein